MLVQIFIASENATASRDDVRIITCEPVKRGHALILDVFDTTFRNMATLTTHALLHSYNEHYMQ